jgi:hypothetical protein
LPTVSFCLADAGLLQTRPIRDRVADHDRK